MIKTIVMGMAATTIVTAAGAAGIEYEDAAFLFGGEKIDVVKMSNSEMAETEGQLLYLIGPVLDLVSGLPIVGPLVGPLADGLMGEEGLLISLLGDSGLLGNVPLVGSLLGTVTVLLDPATLDELLPTLIEATEPIHVEVHAGSLVNLSL